MSRFNTEIILNHVFHIIFKTALLQQSMYKMDNSLALNSLWKSCAGNDHQPLQKSGNITEKKCIEMLPIFPVCPWTSCMIRNMYKYVICTFAVVCKIWISQGKVKSPIIWDFPNNWKLNTTGITNTNQLQMNKKMEWTLAIVQVVSSKMTRSSK